MGVGLVLTIQEVNQVLDQQLPGARVVPQTLPGTGLKLFLLDPDFDDRDLPLEVRESISDNPPYWIFCWASGRALANEILTGRIDVRNRKVLDFGAGSGVVALAAKLAGARHVTTCDIDSLGNQLIALHARLNEVEIDIRSCLSDCDRDYDLVFAADVLYEPKNLVWLDELLAYGAQVIVADSRQKQLNHPVYEKIETVTTTSFPDFAEAKTFNEVNFYRTR